MRAARRSSTTTCASCARSSAPPRTYQRTVYRPGELCQFDLWEPEGRDPGRPRPDAPRLGRDLRARLLAGRRRRAGLLEAARRPALGHEPLPGAARRPARDAGLGPRGGDPRRRRAPDRGLRRLLRPARGRLAHPRAGDPESKGALERTTASCGRTSSRRALRQPARLPRPARPLVRERPTALAPRRPRPSPSASPRSASDAAAARADAADAPRVIRVPQQPYLRVDTNDYSLDPRFAGAGSRCASASADRAVALDTGELSHATAALRQAPDDHRPCAPARARAAARRRDVASPRSRSARWPATTP